MFTHWPVEVDAIRPLIPPNLEVDTYHGRAYLGIVPFRMEDVAPRGLPAPPVAGAFLELNVRTYVRHRDLPGVWFLSLDAGSRIAVESARAAFHLPYFHGAMSLERRDGSIWFASERTDRRGPPATFRARYRPSGPIGQAAPGSLEAWLTDRSRLFAASPTGGIERTEIRHAPWPLQPAEADLAAHQLAAAHGIALSDAEPHLRYAARLDVRAWWPRPA